MELTYFLAKLFGLSFAIFGLIGSLKPKLIKDVMENFQRHPLTDLLFGFIGIVVGLSIVLSHNIWETGWSVIITLFGWAALIKGITFLYAPEILMGFGRLVYKNQSQTKLLLFVTFFFGLYLAGKGFMYL